MDYKYTVTKEVSVAEMKKFIAVCEASCVGKFELNVKLTEDHIHDIWEYCDRQMKKEWIWEMLKDDYGAPGTSGDHEHLIDGILETFNENRRKGYSETNAIDEAFSVHEAQIKEWLPKMTI